MQARRRTLAWRSVPAFLAGVVLLAVGACGVTAGPGTVPSRAAPATAVTSSAAIPPAADGTDLSACADGRCDVRVEQPVVIPVEPRFGVTNLVVAPAADRVTVTASGPASYRTECSDDRCRSKVTAPSMYEAQLSVGSRLVFPTVAIQLVALTGGSAVIRLGPP